MHGENAVRDRPVAGADRGSALYRCFAAYHRFNDYLASAITWFAIAILALVVLVLIYGAVSRYTTGMGYDWVLDMPPRAMPWLVFPMVGVLLRKNGHVTVDVLPTLIARRYLTLLRATGLTISLAACVAFAMAGTEAVQFFQRLNQMSTTEIRYPIWYLYLSFPVGFILAANFCLDALLTELTGRRDSETRAGA